MTNKLDKEIQNLENRLSELRQQRASLIENVSFTQKEIQEFTSLLNKFEKPIVIKSTVEITYSLNTKNIIDIYDSDLIDLCHINIESNNDDVKLILEGAEFDLPDKLINLWEDLSDKIYDLSEKYNVNCYTICSKLNNVI